MGARPGPRQPRAPAYATLAAGLSDLDSAERTLTERVRFTVADDLTVRSGAVTVPQPTWVSCVS
jgi:hypothetical protein